MGGWTVSVTDVVDDTYTLCKKCHGVLIFDKDEQEFFHIGGGKECIEFDEPVKGRRATPGKTDHRPWGHNEASGSF